MADNKAYLESIARSFGYFYGKDKNVRINTISQSPTPTTAGQGVKGFDGFITYANLMSPLGNATADDCANYTVTLFSDLTLGIKPAGCVYSRKVMHTAKPDFKIIHICQQGKQRFIRIQN